MAGVSDSGRRAPPAYQEYAADLLADRDFRSMSAVERGVLFTMRLECWCNESVPSDPAALARVLGLNDLEINAGLTPRVLRHFASQEGTEGVLVCPRLNTYRIRLDERHAALSAGGKKGADALHRGRRERTTLDGQATEQANGPLSRAEQSRTEPNPVYRVTNEHAEFLAANAGNAPFEEAAARRRNGAAVST